MKKIIWPIVAVLVTLGVIAVAYTIWSSKQKPEDVVVLKATDTNTTSTMTDSALTAQPTGTTVVDVQDSQNAMHDTEEGDVYTVVANSTLGWKAGKPTGAHTGTVNVKEGVLIVKDGAIIGGDFVFDMTSLKMLDTDMPRLEGEIRGKFFEATAYPESIFVLQSVTPSDDGYMVAGDLTIRNITKSIVFPATITMNGDTIAAKATFAVNKHNWELHHRDNIMNQYLQFMIDMTWKK